MKKPQDRDPGAGGDAPRREGPPEAWPARKARQGEIILNTPGRRAIFVAGLVSIAILLLVLAALGA